MPNRPAPRHPLQIRLRALPLSASIALGMWLGFIAIALTCWLAVRVLFTEPLAPVAQAVQQLTQPPVERPVPDIPSQSPLFEQYKENLYKNTQQQTLDQARSNIQNQSVPMCQFWLQQHQTAPSEKTRANVLQFCD